MGKRIYVGNLSYDTTENTLRDLFAEFGEVASVNLVTDRYSGRSRGFAFVEMGTDTAAKAAITGLNGKMVDDRELNVAEAKPQEQRTGGGGQRGGGQRGGTGQRRTSRW